MIALIPLILEILMKLAGYFMAKAEEKNKAEKELVEFFKGLDKVNTRASNMRRNYEDAKERLRDKSHDV